MPVLFSHERYEQVLSLLKVPVQNMHPVVVEVLSEEAVAAKCEALYAIHDSDSLEELRKLLADKAENSRVFRDVQLAVNYSFIPWILFFLLLNFVDAM